MRTSYAVTTSEGRIRKQNQDNYFLNGSFKEIEQSYCSDAGSSMNKYQNFAVCDGMGGELAGEYAAYLAVRTMAMEPPERLHKGFRHYLNKANKEICTYSEKLNGRSGTTFAGVFCAYNHITIVNIGDSRVYLIQDGEIKQLSKDHTEFQYLVDTGRIQEEDYKDYRYKNRLTQYLGIPEEEASLGPFIYSEQVKKAGAYILICSDGLYSVLQESDFLAEIEKYGSSLEEKTANLVKMAETKFSKDNVSALLIRIDALDPDDYIDDELLERTLEPDDIITKYDSNEYELTLTKEDSISQTNEMESVILPHCQNDNKGKPCFGFVKHLLRVGLILLILVGIYLFCLFCKTPNVEGLTDEQAWTSLQNHSFVVIADYEYNNNVAKSVVVSQSIPANKYVRKNSPIRIVISKGQEPVDIPDFTGKPLADAYKELEKLSMYIDIIYEKNDIIPYGIVITQVPNNTSILPGSIVKLTVSDGE